MDRAQNLRMLMKQQQQMSSSGGSAGMAGKDKVKMLKMMKAQQSGSVVPAEPIRAKVQEKQPKMSHTTGVAQGSQLPSDFFDNADTFQAPANNNHATKATASSCITTSALPEGFYDDPLQDMVAHGVSVHTFQAEKEKRNQEDLSNFLAEIDQISEEVGLEEAAVIAQESEVQEQEETALQMAYMAKLAVLLKQSDSKTSSSSNNSEDSSNLAQMVAEADAISSLVKVDDTGSARLVGQGSHSAVTQIEDILRRKRKGGVAAIDPYATTNHKLFRRPEDNTSSGDSKSSHIINGGNPQGNQEDEEEEEDEESSDEENEYNPLEFL